MLPKSQAGPSGDAVAEAQTAGAANGLFRDSVLSELSRVLQSRSFRTSRQCQRFLQHVVEQTLAGNEDALHERRIGCDLFGRKPDYDPSVDPVVRVRAGEIRKRLAQYYMESGVDSAMRLELPVGSYCARFTATPTAEPASLPQAPVAEPRRRRWVRPAAITAAVVMGISILVLAALWLPPAFSREPALAAFWEPVFASKRPTVICSGHPVVYFLSSRVHQRYRKEQQAKTSSPVRGPYVIPLRPDELVEGRDIVPVTDQYVGVGDSVVTTRLAALFARQGKDFQVRFGNDISFADLRSAPAVLIGAFSNRWTLSLTEKLRFIFDFDSGVKRIVDRADSSRQWALPEIAPDGKVGHDYAIVSRVFDSETGELLISAGGITQYGTQASAEFLVNDKLIAEAVRNAPADWRRRNLQVILHTKVVGRTSGPPEIVAAHFW